MTPPADKSASVQPAARADATRQALVDAATVAFAQHGFAAASIREIAQTAGANQALVSYHFGGKEGLYLAVFEHIVAQVQSRFGDLGERVARTLNQRVSRRRRLETLFDITDNMLLVMASEQSTHWAQLIVREQLSPTKAFDILFDGVGKNLLGLLTELIAQLHPVADLTTVRLIVVGIMGQAIAYRVARTGILRHMHWRDMGPDELALAQAHMRAHLGAILKGQTR